ncbi:ABC transporter ATP-binding protein [Actinobaculum sp. 313]|uniref:ABC transporter ATP-binding protein n=1 Tax=Actinobaculum sp. 313 TaxID=2495645 RepID=UPI000D526052|nr:ABC transporter ATP-binding protein [Actinobaculum sp. 313]
MTNKSSDGAQTDGTVRSALRADDGVPILRSRGSGSKGVGRAAGTTPTAAAGAAKERKQTVSTNSSAAAYSSAARTSAAAVGTIRAAGSATAIDTEYAIEVTGLVKTFGSLHAVDGLDLKVPCGQIHGFLGPNGAGKSTTIRVLSGMYHRDSGVVRVQGCDPARDAVTITRNTAYVPGDVALWPSLTGAQTLDAFAALRGKRDRSREIELIDAFSLDPNKPVRSYSKGNRQKVALIAALAAPCELLVLDEPSSGLDPLQEEVFMAAVRDAAAQGRTVLLSSHLLSEVDQVCDAVTIIKDGKTVEAGTLASLRHLRNSTISCRLPEGAVPPLPDGVSQLAGLGRDVGALQCRAETSGGMPTRDSAPGSPQAVLRYSVPSESVSEALTALIQAGAYDISCTPASLEELFLRHYHVSAR